MGTLDGECDISIAILPDDDYARKFPTQAFEIVQCSATPIVL